LPVRPLIRRDNEAQAICRDDFSDISPLTGASVAFSTLEGRPSAYDFENSAILQVRGIQTQTVQRRSKTQLALMLQ